MTFSFGCFIRSQRSSGTVKVDKLIGGTLNFNTLDKQLAKIKTGDLALKSKVIKVD